MTDPYSDYVRAMKDGKKPTKGQRAAAAAYMRAWRHRNGKPQQDHRERLKARQRAQTKLAQRHPEEFDRLVRAEKRKAGL